MLDTSVKESCQMQASASKIATSLIAPLLCMLLFFEQLPRFRFRTTAMNDQMRSARGEGADQGGSDPPAGTRYHHFFSVQFHLFSPDNVFNMPFFREKSSKISEKKLKNFFLCCKLCL